MNFIDRAIGMFAPSTALRRARARAALRVYDAADPGRRASAWRGRRLSANSEIGPALAKLRDRSRDLARNTPWAPRMLDILVGHMVGTGLKPVSATGNDRLDQKVNDLWEEWNQVARADGVSTFDAMQSLATRSMIESGDIVMKFVDTPIDQKNKWLVPFKVQLLEGDFIDHDRDGIYTDAGDDTDRSRLGVGLGEYDRRSGLWLFPYHPGEMSIIPRTVKNGLLSQFTPMDNLVHVFREQRPGQIRGVPWFAPMMMTARDLADYMDALVVKARVEACFAGFITNDDEFERVIEPDPSYTDRTDGAAVTTLEPGMLKELKSGQDIKFAQPTSTAQIEPALMYPLFAMCAAVGVTYDQATGDLRGANYSSLRAGKLDFKRLTEQNQNHILIPRMCAPVWRKFIRTAILSGKLQDRPRGYPVNWVTPAWESVNPKFDQDAEERSVRAGRMTPQEYIASWGGDWRKSLKEFEAFFAECDKLGLVFDIDPRKVSRAGQAQAAPGSQPSAAAPGATSNVGAAANDNIVDSDGNMIDPQDLQDAIDALVEEGRGLPFH